MLSQSKKSRYLDVINLDITESEVAPALRSYLLDKRIILPASVRLSQCAAL